MKIKKLFVSSFNGARSLASSFDSRKLCALPFNRARTLVSYHSKLPWSAYSVNSATSRLSMIDSYWRLAGGTSDEITAPICMYAIKDAKQNGETDVVRWENRGAFFGELNEKIRGGDSSSVRKQTQSAFLMTGKSTGIPLVEFGELVAKVLDTSSIEGKDRGAFRIFQTSVGAEGDYSLKVGIKETGFPRFLPGSAELEFLNGRLNKLNGRRVIPISPFS